MEQATLDYQAVDDQVASLKSECEELVNKTHEKEQQIKKSQDLRAQYVEQNSYPDEIGYYLYQILQKNEMFIKMPESYKSTQDLKKLQIDIRNEAEKYWKKLAIGFEELYVRQENKNATKSLKYYTYRRARLASLYSYNFVRQHELNIYKVIQNATDVLDKINDKNITKMGKKLQT